VKDKLVLNGAWAKSREPLLNLRQPSICGDGEYRHFQFGMYVECSKY